MRTDSYRHMRFRTEESAILFLRRSAECAKKYIVSLYDLKSLYNIFYAGDLFLFELKPSDKNVGFIVNERYLNSYILEDSCGLYKIDFPKAKRIKNKSYNGE